MVKKSTQNSKLRKEVRLIKSLMPSQREVVATFSGSAPLAAGAITYLSNTNLDTEKLLLRGIDCRFTAAVAVADTVGCMVRHILFMFDCDVDYTNPASPIVSIPSADDILEDISTYQAVGLLSIKNSRRIQVLYDSTMKLQPTNVFEDIRMKKVFFKKPKELSAMKDRQRVKRPFVLTIAYTSTGTLPAHLNGSIGVHLHTTQIP